MMAMRIEIFHVAAQHNLTRRKCNYCQTRFCQMNKRQFRMGVILPAKVRYAGGSRPSTRKPDPTAAQLDNRHSVVVAPPFGSHTLLQFVP